MRHVVTSEAAVWPGARVITIPGAALAAPGLRLCQAVGVVPEVPAPPLPLQRGLEVDGPDRRGDEREVVVMAHAGRDAVAWGDVVVPAFGDGRPRAFEDDPV